MCVALTVYAEARGEPLAGQRAVAYVVHNRAGGDPKKYCSVARRGGQFARFPAHVKGPEWRNAVAVARSFRSFPDPSHGSTYFHERKARPVWRHKKVLVARVGAHLFYREG